MSLFSATVRQILRLHQLPVAQVVIPPRPAKPKTTPLLVKNRELKQITDDKFIEAVRKHQPAKAIDVFNEIGWKSGSRVRGRLKSLAAQGVIERFQGKGKRFYYRIPDEKA